MSYKKGPSLRSLIFRLMLSVCLALAGLTGLLVTRLTHPLILDILAPWREPAPSTPFNLDGQAFKIWPLMKNQLEIDLACAVLTALGIFMIIFYRRRLSPLLTRLEGIGLDRC